MKKCSFGRVATCAGAAAVMLAGCGGPSRSEAAGAKDFGAIEKPIVISPLTWSPTLTPIAAFKATDGLYHLQYQLLLTDVFARTAEIVGGDVLDAHTHRPTGHNLSLSDDGSDIRLKIRSFSAPGEGHGADFGNVVPPGTAGLMFFYLSYPTLGAVPSHIEHVFTAEQTNGGVTIRRTATDAGLTPVSTERPLVIAPPMRGTGWLDGNGAGPAIYEHRATYQPANGTAKPDQAFAIDWIKLDDKGRVFTGDPLKNESFFAYGQPILSATGGLVVKAQDAFSDQIPNRTVPVTTLKELYGNFVIVEIVRGKYAVYCHLKPGSIAVKAGERVHVGQQLAKLGNSGNSTAPHLHFQISDAPSVVNADSLPFVFNRMYYRMRIAGPIFPTVDKMTESAFVARFDRTGAGWRNLEMPLQGDVVDFP